MKGRKGREKGLDARKRILEALEQGGATVDQLQNRTNLGRATVYAQVNRLVHFGEVYVEIDDRGRKVFKLTRFLAKEFPGSYERLYEGSTYYAILRRFLDCGRRAKRRNTQEIPLLAEREICKEFGLIHVSRDTVHDILTNLVEDRLLDRISFNSARVSRLSKCCYRLTKNGFLWALKTSELHKFTKNKWNDIASTYCPFFPDFLGKWDVFIKNGSEDLAIETIESAINRRWIWNPKESSLPIDVMERLTYEFIFPTPNYNDDLVFSTEMSITQGDAWLRTITGDNDLLELACKQASDKYRIYDGLARKWKQISEHFRKRVSDPTFQITQPSLLGLQRDTPETAFSELFVKMHSKSARTEKDRELLVWLGRSVKGRFP